MSKALKVGLSTNLLEPEHVRRGLDGIGVYTSVLKEGLPQHGCEVQCWSFPPLHKNDKLVVGQALPAPHKMLLARDLVLPGFRTHMPADLFHVTDYHIVRMDCPIVATLHDAITLKYPQWYPGLMRSVKSGLLRKTAQFADRVIALSHAAIPELVQYLGVREERISVVPCGVASHWFDALPQERLQQSWAQYGLRPGYFLFVGTLQIRKNVDRIIEAYLRLPEQIRKERQLLIVGRAGWRSEETVARIHGAQARGEQVIWPDYVAGEDTLRSLYAGAGALVFPSLHEGFGIPVVEAFASGVPVIASNTTSLPEVCGGAALEIDPLSVDALADAMRSIVSDDALRARCIDAGRRRASQLTWQNTVLQTVDVYKSVLAS